MKFLYIIIFVSLTFSDGLAQLREKNLPPEHPQISFKASPKPDRIILTWTEDPATTQTVTWRTDTTVEQAYAQIALADASPSFHDYAKKYEANHQRLQNEFSYANYHYITFENLTPNTKYVYRVGMGHYWSEWIQFQTPKRDFEPFSFIYMGDAQNNIYSRWARTIRAAYNRSPEAKFVLHVGDLINHSQNDYEWASWFYATEFMSKMIPTIAIPGNHEYVKNREGQKTGISPFWNPQFNYPLNGPKELEDRCFYIDMQGIRVIGLDSNEDIKKQAIWLEEVLKNNKNEWTFVMFHHPVVSAAKGRVNGEILELWKPILDQYKVDIVFQGHDHTYARAQNLITDTNDYEKNSGTVYLVSVSGTKMYTLSEQPWMTRAAENTQLFQVIDVEKNHLVYRSYTPEGKVYDAFKLVKSKGPNILHELPTDIKTDRRFANTLKEVE